MGLQAKTKDEKYEKIKNKKISVTIEALWRGFPKEFSKFFELCRNLGFEDKPDYTNYRRMLSDLMTAEGYTYDYQYDWLLRKSDREALRGPAIEDKDEEEDKEEVKVMTKAEEFRLKYQNKPSELKDKPDVSKIEDSKKTTKDTTPVPTIDDKTKVLSKKPSTNRKTFNGKPPIDKEEAKKPSIYDAMKDTTYGTSKPKIVTTI